MLNAVRAKVKGRKAIADIVVLVGIFGRGCSRLRGAGVVAPYQFGGGDQFIADVAAVGTMRERRERAGGRVRMFFLLRICPHCSHRQILYHFSPAKPNIRYVIIGK